ncbi:hypothetical protein BBK36DRAFT_1204266 [Trichoderma citrinoviride]|uniref:Fungal-type protein kinase domain-containing protein n=1 Tax=Trichoderma citrinoviride TaxID=58853 RepID=A0A2T4B750_9HYPO|nr:hypothetical protein BBK36DRAFT_1204266 [Trichoderma citrinoviride]PTB65130.1 hypothetical protein BBK36DRAFT_1204266 [Trichoderma citrinoviride]
MSNPADFELVKGISITDELKLVHASFNIMCNSQYLPPLPPSLHLFQSRQIQLLASTLLNALFLAMPSTSPARACLSVLATLIISNSDAVDRMRPLVEAAIPYRPDTTLVWNLVFQQVTEISKPTPSQPVDTLLEAPERAPTVPHGPPNTKHGESEQDTQRLRDHFQNETFKEIQGCTYSDVEGFFERFFEGKDWTDRALDLYEKLKVLHINNVWVRLGVSPGVARMKRWLDSMQGHLHEEEHSRYWEVTLPNELTEGVERNRFDLCVKRKCGEPSVATIEWKDLTVIGQLTAEGAFKKRLVQLACYAKHLFDFQPTRRYLHAFTICGSTMETWVFDRSGCYGPGAFDIHQHPERFIRVMAGYIMMSAEDLGLDTFIQQDGDTRFINIEGHGGEEKRLDLCPTPLNRRLAIVSRATSCVLAKHADSDDYDHVVKFSWPLSEQKEVHLLQKAGQRGVEGIIRLVAHYEITDIDDMRRGMTFGKRYTFDDTASGMPFFSQAPPPKRCRRSKRNRTSDAPASRPLQRYQSPFEMLTAIRDAIKAHQSLYCKGKMLHRDISENNIIITDAKKTGFSGMLIDFDLVEELDKGPVNPEVRTGTIQFMAIRVLRSIEHTYRQDLESFFYVLLWQCIVRGWEFVGRRNPAVVSELHGWRAAKSFGHMARNKQSNMDKECFDDVLGEFPAEFEGLKPLCRTLRSILFPIKNGALFTGTPSDPNTLYGSILEAFDEVIANGQKGREKERVILLREATLDL